MLKNFEFLSGFVEIRFKNHFYIKAKRIEAISHAITDSKRFFNYKKLNIPFNYSEICKYFCKNKKCDVFSRNLQKISNSLEFLQKRL